MAETTWSEETAEPPKKKGIPLWLWGCGGGCLLMVALGLVLGVFLVGRIQDAADPEKAWPKVAEVLPFDERPPYDAFAFSVFGMSLYALRDPESGDAVIVFRADNDDPEETDRVFRGEERGGFAGIGEMEDPEPRTVVVRGRECRALLVTGKPPALPMEGKQAEESQVMLLVDISSTPEELVMLQFVPAGGDPEERLQAFLEPFGG